MTEKSHILVIDDDEFVRDMLQQTLTYHGYQVYLAETGAAALEFSRKLKPDIAFIDINLPDTWGTELIRELKKIQPELLCIIITGDPSLDSVVDALHHGAEAFFQKPMKMDEVLARLDSLAEKKNLQDEISRLNELPRIILNGINEAVAIIDTRDYSIISANKVFIKEAGLPEDQIIGSTCHAITHNRSTPCGGENDICPLEEAIATGHHAMAEHIHFDANGKKSYVEITVSPIKDKSGEVVQAIHVSRDITLKKELEISLEHERKLLQQANEQLQQAFSELKQTQSQIVQQEKMASIGQLAAGVAHEINNPMGFITSNLSSLGKYLEKMTRFIALQDSCIKSTGAGEEVKKLGEERKKMKIDFLLDDIPSLIEESLDGANRVKNIVQNLKSFSRVDGNEVARININECLDTTLNIVWNELKYKAEIIKDYGDIPLVMGSGQQLNQVFMNILVNAAQSIEKRGEIRIKTWREKDSVRIAITDTGCGIDPVHLSRIFEPFFTTKEVGKGTGLGMSIVYDIIKKHHGEIRVDSELGKGSTFTISLPEKEKPSLSRPSAQER